MPRDGRAIDVIHRSTYRREPGSGIGSVQSSGEEDPVVQVGFIHTGEAFEHPGLVALRVDVERDQLDLVAPSPGLEATLDLFPSWQSSAADVRTVGVIGLSTTTFLSRCARSKGRPSWSVSETSGRAM
jgi:hypothetical protein